MPISRERSASCCLDRDGRTKTLLNLLWFLSFVLFRRKFWAFFGGKFDFHETGAVGLLSHSVNLTWPAFDVTSVEHWLSIHKIGVYTSRGHSFFTFRQVHDHDRVESAFFLQSLSRVHVVILLLFGHGEKLTADSHHLSTEAKEGVGPLRCTVRLSRLKSTDDCLCCRQFIREMLFFLSVAGWCWQGAYLGWLRVKKFWGIENQRAATFVY